MAESIRQRTNRIAAKNKKEVINANSIHDYFARWRADGGWKLFAREVLQVQLDREQEAILDSVQKNKMTSVASGTARGKDFVSAVAALCFLYLTPRWNDKGQMIANTKVALTAPTSRQVENIMMPEISRMFRRAGVLHGRLLTDGIRTESEEWFLVGFKADEHNHEAWSGFHAANTMFVVTEASGISDDTFDAIEGNLQGNSRLLLVFNPNRTVGYAAKSQRSPRFAKFRLNSLNAPNVIHRREIFSGQVDYDWIMDKINAWCLPVARSDYKPDENGDFEFNGKLYTPNDTFRIKVLGLFPKVSEDKLIPMDWITAAVDRWKKFKEEGLRANEQVRIGSDIAGAGRDASVDCYRRGNFVEKFVKVHSGGTMNHMETAGKINVAMKEIYNEYHGEFPQVFIDSIGEGAGVYSRLIELANEFTGNDHLKDTVHSVKYSEKAYAGDNPLTDRTGVYKFLNMRAYLYWAVRDWLNPSHDSKAMLPDDDELFQELTEVQYKFTSNGAIQIEPKEDIRARLKRSPDKFDSLANTFYPVDDLPRDKSKSGNDVVNFFF